MEPSLTNSSLKDHESEGVVQAEQRTPLSPLIRVLEGTYLSHPIPPGTILSRNARPGHAGGGAIYLGYLDDQYAFVDLSCSGDSITAWEDLTPVSTRLLGSLKTAYDQYSEGLISDVALDEAVDDAVNLLLDSLE